MQSQIAFKVERLERQDVRKLDAAIYWLEGFRKVYVRDFEKVLKLVPESVWKNYKTMGAFRVKGIYEIDERKRVGKLLKDQWAQRPECLCRVKKKNEAKAGKT